MARRTIVILSLAFASLGCAIRNHETPATNPWPPAQASEKKSVGLVLSIVNGPVGGDALDAPPARAASFREWTEATYRDSALFSTIVAEGAPSDVRAEVEIDDRTESMQPLVNELTERFTIRTEFKDAKGEVLATVLKSESIDTWFGIPFEWPTSELRGLITDLNRATLAEAHAQGII